MQFGSWPFAWDPRILLPFLWPLILFSNVSSASLISQSDSFGLPTVMGCTGVALFAVYCNPQATMDIMLPSFFQGNPTFY